MTFTSLMPAEIQEVGIHFLWGTVLQGLSWSLPRPFIPRSSWFFPNHNVSAFFTGSVLSSPVYFPGPLLLWSIQATESGIPGPCQPRLTVQFPKVTKCMLGAFPLHIVSTWYVSQALSLPLSSVGTLFSIPPLRGRKETEVG